MQKKDLYTWPRIGRSCHGEVRNGGIPACIYKKRISKSDSAVGWLPGYAVGEAYELQRLLIQRKSSQFKIHSTKRRRYKIQH
ncbi:hypothetical protein JW960_29535 [candidate division KSB1 bacterium]|nr:hypothetical protein [candidate division KSB1 bacterium]